MIGVDPVAFKSALRRTLTIKMFALVIAAQLFGYWFLDRFYQKDPVILAIGIGFYSVLLTIFFEYRKDVRKNNLQKSQKETTDV